MSVNKSLGMDVVIEFVKYYSFLIYNEYITNDVICIIAKYCFKNDFKWKKLIGCDIGYKINNTIIIGTILRVNNHEILLDFNKNKLIKYCWINLKNDKSICINNTAVLMNCIGNMDKYCGYSITAKTAGFLPLLFEIYKDQGNPYMFDPLLLNNVNLSRQRFYINDDIIGTTWKPSVIANTILHEANVNKEVLTKILTQYVSDIRSLKCKWIKHWSKRDIIISLLVSLVKNPEPFKVKHKKIHYKLNRICEFMFWFTKYMEHGNDEELKLFDELRENSKLHWNGNNFVNKLCSKYKLKYSHYVKVERKVHKWGKYLKKLVINSSAIEFVRYYWYMENKESVPSDILYNILRFWYVNQLKWESLIGCDIGYKINDGIVMGTLLRVTNDELFLDFGDTRKNISDKYLWIQKSDSNLYYTEIMMSCMGSIDNYISHSPTAKNIGFLSLLFIIYKDSYDFNPSILNNINVRDQLLYLQQNRMDTQRKIQKITDKISKKINGVNTMDLIKVLTKYSNEQKSLKYKEAYLWSTHHIIVSLFGYFIKILDLNIKSQTIKQINKFSEFIFYLIKFKDHATKDELKIFNDIKTPSIQLKSDWPTKIQFERILNKYKLEYKSFINVKKRCNQWYKSYIQILRMKYQININ